MIKIRLEVRVRVRFRVRIGVKFKIQKNTKLQILKIAGLANLLILFLLISSYINIRRFIFRLKIFLYLLILFSTIL
jgi:uncharacterized membrane protein YqjE